TVEAYRKTWWIAFPFINVQLSSYGYDGLTNWGQAPMIRAAQYDAVKLIPGLGNRGAALIQRMKDKLIEHKLYIREFGADLPAERVLNAKRPLNFILDEPTRLKYIDPTMALDNAGALEVLTGRVERGVADPPAELEKEILDTVRRSRAIGEELNWIGDENHEVDFH
ncbi:MAG: hypothetical protein J6Y54_05065, partial [Lentisphaeria bacterium]|nr:hypothetical protein [Lentisphaeria bacterium]